MNNFHFEFDYDLSVPEGTEKTLLRAAECCLLAEGVTQPCAAYLCFTDDEHIHVINREQRNVDRSTDVLSFPCGPFTPAHTAGHCPKTLKSLWDMDTRASMLGDIIISLDHARAQAEEFGHSFQRELVYLTVHALFHLMGYDHMKDEDKIPMRRMEEKALTMAGVSRVSDEELLSAAQKAQTSDFSVCLLADDETLFTASSASPDSAVTDALLQARANGKVSFVTLAVLVSGADFVLSPNTLCSLPPMLRVILFYGNTQTETSVDVLLSK